MKCWTKCLNTGTGSITSAASVFIALLLLILSSASLSAQAEPSPSSTLPREGPDASLPPPESSWRKLDSMLGELENRAMTLAERSEKLELELKQVQSESAERLSLLSQAETTAAALSSSLARVETSLQASSEDLAKAQAQIRRDKLSSMLWRAGALAGGLGVAGALVDATPGRGAAIGAASGAAVGLIWFLLELWARTI